MRGDRKARPTAVKHLEHEPALKEDGTVYRPNLLDDSGGTSAWDGYLCRLCHCYYANPKSAGEYRQSHLQGPHPKLVGRNICAAKLAALFVPTADTEMPL